MHAHHPHDTASRATPITDGHTIGWARWYDWFVNLATLGNANVLRQSTVAIAKLAPGESVLEIGCGTGAVALIATTQVGATGRVVGVDAAPEMIAVARGKAARAGFTVEFFAQPAEQMAFADDSFDVALSSLMMHHLPDTLKQQALAEVARVLKPGGRLIIVDIRRPASFTGRVVNSLLLHGALRTGVQDLVDVLQHSGFSIEEQGVLPIGLVGFIRANVTKEGTV